MLQEGYWKRLTRRRTEVLDERSGVFMGDVVYVGVYSLGRGYISAHENEGASLFTIVGTLLGAKICTRTVVIRKMVLVRG